MTEYKEQIDRIDGEVVAQTTLLDQALALIEGKASGGGGGGGDERKYATGTFSGGSSVSTRSVTGLGFRPTFIFVFSVSSFSMPKGTAATNLVEAWDGKTQTKYGLGAQSNSSGIFQSYPGGGTTTITDDGFSVAPSYKLKATTYRWFAFE